MANNPFHLFTPIEAEAKFGKKYFYRQRIYRLAQNRKIPELKHQGQICFLGSHILEAFLKDLELKIQSKFPEININTLRIFYDTVREKRIVVDGLLGRGISVNTDEETEEDLLTKIKNIIEWVGHDSLTPEVDEGIIENESPERLTNIDVHEQRNRSSLTEVLPEEISWVRVDTGNIQGVDIKSFILISLPSVAQFIGIRTDAFIKWIATTTFAKYILSAHYKQLQGTQNSVPWKKGVIDGLTSLIPFELIPEVIVAFKHSGRTPEYPEKAELLYQLAKTTLEAVGLAISGSRDKAAQELARVGQGLGLTAADQIIGIFKQYETREYQIQTTKEFNSKVKEIKANYAVTIGTLTLGITGRYPSQWKALGISRQLPKKITTSSREVMRKLSPGDGVGMTFGEKHFIKEQKIEEASETGRQGKDFYERLKRVGLLDN